MKSCTACGRAHHYPRPHCPFYSYGVMRRATPPYVIAYVTLDEGPTMMTNLVDCDLVDCDFEALRIGQAVRVVWTPTDGGPSVPMFTPR